MLKTVCHITTTADACHIQSDDEAGLIVSILDMDRFQDGWWQCSLRDSAQILAERTH